ncbi:MAG: ROK family protein, partial [Clostridia bacterium]|nr:ROK family protein [Clostridia bacterium]
MKEYAVGIDVGGTNISVGLFDQEMHTVKSIETLTDTELEADRMMDHVAALVKRLMQETHLERDAIRGVGAAFPS